MLQFSYLENMKHIIVQHTIKSPWILWFVKYWENEWGKALKATVSKQISVEIGELSMAFFPIIFCLNILTLEHFLTSVFACSSINTFIPNCSIIREWIANACWVWVIFIDTPERRGTRQKIWNCVQNVWGEKNKPSNNKNGEKKICTWDGCGYRVEGNKRKSHKWILCSVSHFHSDNVCPTGIDLINNSKRCINSHRLTRRWNWRLVQWNIWNRIWNLQQKHAPNFCFFR